MARRIDRLRSRAPEARSSMSFQDWADSFKWGGNQYGLTGMSQPITTWGTDPTESIGNSYDGFVHRGIKGNPVVFALVSAQLRLFTQARFQWQRMLNGKPGDLFGTQELELLEQPWANATTSDLLARMWLDATAAGNFYGVRRPDPVAGRDRIRRWRPDLVQIVAGSHTGSWIDAEPTLYLFWQERVGKGTPLTFLPEQVVHFAPVPDPDAGFRGMSWMTPAIEEIRADTAATRHKGKFFDNAATPNMAVSLDKAVPKREAQDFIEQMRGHEGADNAYQTLWLAGGADVKVVGADFKQLDFRATQGAGESRIAADSGVPPIIAGLPEGLSAATYSNYGQARRQFGDLWARPMWAEAAGALQSIFPPKAGARLWYDDDGIPFLREDQKDEADILGVDGATIRTLTDGGYEPDSVVAAVRARDFSLLKHSGLLSVQMQPPGATPDA